MMGPSTQLPLVRSLFFLTIVLLLPAMQATKWECNKADGYWYADGEKTEYTDKCGTSSGDGKKDDGKKAADCTASNDPGMPQGYTKTCISGPPAGDPRCWYTYVPKSVIDTGVKVPLVIDMHGGGGCASHQALTSGFKELSDSFAKGADTFVSVWPQAHATQWGTAGADSEAEAKSAEKIGKGITMTDDVTFLMDMIAYVLKSTDSAEVNPGKGYIDAARIYLTGFSMGCMMSHRLSLERSDAIAGFGCHGGTLIGMQNPDSPTHIAQQKSRFKLQPMPVYMTGGTSDGWFDMAKPIFGVWSTLNGCSAESTTNVTLPASEQPWETGITSATLKRRSSCAGDAEVVRLEIINGTHAPDTRMAKYTWEFLKSHSRADVLASLGAAPASVTPASDTKGASSADASSARTATFFGVVGAVFVIAVAM